MYDEYIHKAHEPEERRKARLGEGTHGGAPGDPFLFDTSGQP